MNWITVNKPWRLSVDVPKPPYPTELVQGKMREKFGQTMSEIEAEFKTKFGRESVEVEMTFQHKIDPNFDMDEDTLIAKMEESTDPLVVACLKERERFHEVRDFMDSIPEVIAWIAEDEEAHRQMHKLTTEGSFKEDPLNRPGVLIEVLSDGELSKYLIGDINHLGGDCDDCNPFEDDAVVTRALVLISEEELKKRKEHLPD
jgi:hypothetical protein